MLKKNALAEMDFHLKWPDEVLKVSKEKEFQLSKMKKYISLQCKTFLEKKFQGKNSLAMAVNSSNSSSLKSSQYWRFSNLLYFNFSYLLAKTTFYLETLCNFRLDMVELVWLVNSFHWSLSRCLNRLLSLLVGSLDLFDLPVVLFTVIFIAGFHCKIRDEIFDNAFTQKKLHLGKNINILLTHDFFRLHIKRWNE